MFLKQIILTIKKQKVMNNSKFLSKGWWLFAAIMYFPFIVFFYMGEKMNSQFWKICSGVFVVICAILLALYNSFGNEIWFQCFAVSYWIFGIVLTLVAWNKYKKAFLS